MYRFIRGGVSRAASSQAARSTLREVSQGTCHTSSKNNINNIAFVMSQARPYSSTTAKLGEEKTDKHDASKTEKDSADASTGEASAAKPEPTSEETIAKLNSDIKELKDQLLRSIAEQENVRRIARIDVENARAYGVQSFAKSMLDVADNFERALSSIPADTHEQIKSGKADRVLATLIEGITATEKGLQKALAGNGVVRFGAVGDKFNPDQHDALFQVPDAAKDEGTIVQILKSGYKLKDRVLRAAQVGTSKKPDA